MYTPHCFSILYFSYCIPLHILSNKIDVSAVFFFFFFEIGEMTSRDLTSHLQLFSLVLICKRHIDLQVEWLAL